jgi:hypothetical protein
MAQQPPQEPVESIVLQAFSGIRNNVRPERLSPAELEAAVNIDLDDAGQPSRRRGYTLKLAGNFHSVREQRNGLVFGVKDGLLGLVRRGFTFSSLGVSVGTAAVCYTQVNGETFFSSSVAQGVVMPDESVQSWGATDGQGTWLSPVIAPTEMLGAIGGQLLGDPPPATVLETYNGRIYMAVGKVLWATEMFRYHYVDRTRNYMQFEHEIVMLKAMNDGIYVGTTGGLFFLRGARLGDFKLEEIGDAAVLPGSDVWVPTELVHPQAANGPVPTGDAAVFMTTAGVCAGFDGGAVFNLTYAKVELPRAQSAAALFRQRDGVNTYVAVTDSGGTPTASVQFGDHVEAEIVRFSGG